jgi:glycosyltransferase involved in cell wall biosynthesis
MHGSDKNELENGWKVLLMNICMIASAVFPPREGMGFYIWNLSRYLLKQGHHVQIITRGGVRRLDYEILEGIPIWRPRFLPIYPIHVSLHGRHVQRLVEHLEPEVDLFHLHSPLVPSIKTFRPIMLSFHSTVRDDIKATKLNSWYTLLMKLQSPVSYRLEVDNLKTASSINAISPMAAEALHHYPHSPPDIPVVWNAVDTDTFKPGANHFPKNNLVLTVGRLGPGKGLEDLIDAVTSIPDPKASLELTIIGDGPLRASLEQQIKAASMQKKIHCEGHIADRNLLIDFYQKASLFVLASHHEGLPTVILEAMACGCPVLATSVGGVPNIIEDGNNGMLVPPRDPHQMAMAIQSLLAEPRKLTEMGLRARQTIEQNFSWEQIGSRFIELYSIQLSKVKASYGS